jgi:hypothetical protein
MSVRLSALRAGQTSIPREIPDTHVCRGSVNPKAILRLEGVGQLKNIIIKRFKIYKYPTLPEISSCHGTGRLPKVRHYTLWRINLLKFT